MRSRFPCDVVIELIKIDCPLSVVGGCCGAGVGGCMSWLMLCCLNGSIGYDEDRLSEAANFELEVEGMSGQVKGVYEKPHGPHGA